jgi:serine protein kinase
MSLWEDKRHRCDSYNYFALQRVTNMFGYCGTEYDEDAGVMKYQLASEDPLQDGEKTFYGRVIHKAIQ